MSDRWLDALPRPIAFVLSGGASLGAIQVGMLQALAEAGIRPDMVVGTSVGALNGAAVAAFGLDGALPILQSLWLATTREDVFPGGRATQLAQLARTRISLFSQERLARLIERTLPATTFEALSFPLTVVTTELLTHRRRLFTSGPLVAPLLASAALPAIYPPVEIEGVSYVDGGLVANTPLQAALEQGAGSIVALDVGDTCLPTRPRHIADILLLTLHTMLRQRSMAEAPLVAQLAPLLYITSPCPVRRNPFDFEGTPHLIHIALESARDFLAHGAIPQCGHMSGGPHVHDDHVVHLMA